MMVGESNCSFLVLNGNKSHDGQENEVDVRQDQQRVDETRRLAPRASLQELSYSGNWTRQRQMETDRIIREASQSQSHSN